MKFGYCEFCKILKPRDKLTIEKICELSSSGLENSYKHFMCESCKIKIKREEN